MFTLTSILFAEAKQISRNVARARTPVSQNFFHFFAKKIKKWILVLTSVGNGVECRSRVAPAGNKKKKQKKMKTIAIVLGLATLTAVGNTLPPTPENTLPPTPEFAM